MPVTEGKYQCRICDDIFEAKSGKFTKCKCGQSEIEPSNFGYSYRNGNRVNEIEQNTYYLEDEFVKLPEDILAIYNEIKQIKEDTGYKYSLMEMTDKGKNGEKYLSNIIISYDDRVHSYSSELNTIKFSMSLKKNEYKGDENTRNRLQRLLEMMKKIESNELDISQRSKMIELAEEERIDYREEPTGETNYTFYL